MSLLDLIEENEGTFHAFITAISWFFLLMLLMCSFGYMHLSYYIISSYVDVIVWNLKLPSIPAFENVSNTSKINQIYWYIMPMVYE